MTVKTIIFESNALAKRTVFSTGRVRFFILFNDRHDSSEINKFAYRFEHTSPFFLSQTRMKLIILIINSNA